MNSVIRRRRRRFLVAVLAILLASVLGAWFVIWDPMQPRFDAKTLDHWLEGFDFPHPKEEWKAELNGKEQRVADTSVYGSPLTGLTSTRIREARRSLSPSSKLESLVPTGARASTNSVSSPRVESERAIRAMVPDVIPHLIRRFSVREVWLKDALRRALKQQRFFDVYLPTSTSTRMRAERALKSLGEIAVPSVAELLESKDLRLRRRAVNLLFDLGLSAREAYSALKSAETDSDPLVALVAGMAIDTMESASPERNALGDSGLQHPRN